MRNITLALAAAAAFAIAAPAQATTIFSVDFSSGFGVFTPTGQVGINTGNDYVPCCGTTGSAANMSNPFASFGSGNLPSGTIETSFTSVLGQAYTLAFDYAVLGAGQDQLTVNIDPLATAFVTVDANNNMDTNFTGGPLTIDFFGTGGLITIDFASAGTNNADAILDNVVLTANDSGVPEPSTWAMMLLGFGTVGFAIRRRRKTLLQAA
jgi:hypothetical protein